MAEDRYEDLEDELASVETQLSDPAVIADQATYAGVARRYKELDQIVSRVRELRAQRADVETAEQLLVDATEDEQAMLASEVDAAGVRIAELEDEIAELLIPKDPNADKNVIVEIKGAEGGEEANLFARDLFEMYRSYAQAHGWKLEVLNAQESDMGGYSDITFLLKGDGIWGHMKYEGGPHRVQRVPKTESQGRVHTSSATVSVLPEAEEIDVQIDDADLQVDVYRSSGPGGQSVNTTDSAVRVTHKPTGIVVAMQDEKSQLQNRNKAMQVLRARLLRLEQERQQAEQSETRRGQIGGGGRSEKIRTYNFKENRVSDHRIGLTLYKLDGVLAGDLDELVGALAEDERRHQLARDG